MRKPKKVVKKPTYILHDSEVVKLIHKWIEDADGDDLARVFGDLYGGECFTINGREYRFTPNEFFAGEYAFTDIIPELGGFNENRIIRP